MVFTLDATPQPEVRFPSWHRHHTWLSSCSGFWQPFPPASLALEYCIIQNSLPNHILCSPHTSGHYLLALITPGPGSRTQGIALVPQSPLKLFKLASPKPFSPASPFPCCGNYKEGSCPQFFPLPLPPDRPWSFPLWPPMTWCPPSSCSAVSEKPAKTKYLSKI